MQDPEFNNMIGLQSKITKYVNNQKTPLTWENNQYTPRLSWKLDSPDRILKDVL